MKKYKKSKGARPLFFHLRWLRLPLNVGGGTATQKPSCPAAQSAYGLATQGRTNHREMMQKTAAGSVYTQIQFVSHSYFFL